MNIYILNIWALILERLILPTAIQDTKAQKKIFCVLGSLQWILISGLRRLDIGPDTDTYKVVFERTLHQDWHELWQQFINILFRGTADKDPGYYLFQKFVQIFTDNYRVYLFVIAIIFTVSLGIWIYRNSKEPLISFLLYSCLFYSFFSITGYRQTIATALVSLIGYRYIQERRLLPFLLVTAVAYTIHKSSLVFLPFYFIANKQITTKYIFVIIISTIILFIFRQQYMALIVRGTAYEHYLENTYDRIGAYTFALMYILVITVTIFKRQAILQSNPQATHFINAAFLGLILLPIAFVDPNGMRVVQYFSIFLMLLVPEIVMSFQDGNKGGERTFVYFIMAVTLLVFLYMKDPVYYFFWQ